MTAKKKTTARKPAKAPAKPRKPAAKTARKEKTPALVISIDFPQAGEVVRPGRYSVRIGTVPPVDLLEVSLDGSDWLKCRNAAGYWWYDWTGYEPGPHRLVARAKNAEGELVETGSRRFRVGVEAEDSAGGAAPDADLEEGSEPVPIDEEPEPQEEAEE